MIGIVGGAGPYAGMELFKKIIEETIAISDQEHLSVILRSIPDRIPDRTEFLEGETEENPAIPISQIFNELEKEGATVAAIPCNTAHAPLIFNEVKRRIDRVNSKLKVLSIIEETVQHLKENYSNITNVGILSTTGTWRQKIYRNPLEKSGYHVLDSRNDGEKNLVHQAIYDKQYGVKAYSSRITKRASTDLHLAAEELIKRGAEVVILGCTEIPLAITNPFIKGIPMIDTLRVLARSLVFNESPKKLKSLNP